MPYSPLDRPTSTKPLSRESLIKMLQAAEYKQEFQYLRQIALGWLAFYPGDLEIKLYYAHALVGLGIQDKALDILEQIIHVDPEYLPALKYLDTLPFNGSKDLIDTSISILDPETNRQIHDPLLVVFHRNYQWLTSQGNLPIHWETYHPGLSAGKHELDLFPSGTEKSITNPLMAGIYLRCLVAQKVDPQAVRTFAEAFHTQWSDSVLFHLILAQIYMHSDQAAGVSLLNDAVALDTTAQVAIRVWGPDFAFRRMWPSDMEISPGHPTSPQSIPVPASVSAHFGWNQLSSSLHQVVSPQNEDSIPAEVGIPQNAQPTLAKTPPAVPKPRRAAPKAPFTPSYPVLSELRQIAKLMKQPALSRIDGRYPIYVVLSSKNGLEKQYGIDSASLILEAMTQLSETIARYRQWGSVVYLVDEPGFDPRLNMEIEPARPDDPWVIKLAIADLDLELSKRGEMIGSILIVGGPNIIPFHHLPNPVDDSDPDVPSDNPYATRDENYFIPEWSLGRFPSGKSKSPELLLKQLKNAKTYHESFSNTHPWYKRFGDWLRSFSDSLPFPIVKVHRSYGYSAAVWRRASLSVFRPIGDPTRLSVSPPLQVQLACATRNPDKSCLELPKGRLAYFNLHGLADTDEWYGQRDPAEPGDDPDFPLALRAADISMNGRSSSNIPEVIFSEACFGANIQGKNNDEVIALRFLSNGCRVVVGSTCISYGSISTPLIAADLLGHTFWHYLKEGQPAGEALRRARIRLVKEMNQRQGYLDGEDQKTLLSFVYYGDPLVQIRELTRGPKTTLRSIVSQPSVNLVCDRKNGNPELARVPEDVVQQVKEFVSRYLPNMKDAELSVSYERARCSGTSHQCPTSQLNAKSASRQPAPKRKVVTLRKTIRDNALRHPQIARMTMDESGKMVKLVVSR